MTETKLWEKLKTAIFGYFEADRIDNKVGTGVPDVTFTLPGKHGWIELKTAPCPRNRKTPIRLNHEFTGRQKYWIAHRGIIGGNIYILIAVGDSKFYLFNWAAISSIGRGVSDLEWWNKNSMAIWEGEIRGEDLRRILE
jgi:hypothetical protein